MTLCFSYFSVDLSSMAKTTPYISPVTTATVFTEPTKSSEVWARYSLHYQRLFCSVCSFEAVDEFVVAVSRNVFRFTNEDSSCSAKRNTNWTSVGFFARKQVLIVSAVGHAFFLPQKDLRWVKERFAGGMALAITVLDPLHTSRQLALL